MDRGDPARGVLPVDEARAIEADCARLINLYATLNDACRWDEVAALYADDGVMIRPTAPDSPAVGRTAILAAFNARAPRVTQHLCGNIVVIVEAADRARGSSAMLLFSGKADPAGGLPVRDEGSPLVGMFHDRFVLTADGWRFAERRGSLTFQPS